MMPELAVPAWTCGSPFCTSEQSDWASNERAFQGELPWNALTASRRSNSPSTEWPVILKTCGAGEAEGNTVKGQGLHDVSMIDVPA
eukprot:1159188-Pelagomonas_calceolata.AAC.9